jgi:hypothetical protein
VIGDIAATFHFPPSELWAMSADDLLFWHGQAVRVNRR